MTVVIAGASGFMGRYLAGRYRARGETVRTIGRAGADGRWGEDLRPVLNGADLLLNLAGRSVDCRYGPANRAEILRSRVETTEQLARAIAGLDEPPPIWMNSSTATIYRHADDRPQDEADGDLGEGFSVSVARAWEHAFFSAELAGLRRVALRTAIVLGNGSVLGPLIRLTRLGLGGAHLDGRWPATAARRRAGTYHRFATPHGLQRISWVHLADVDRAIEFLRTAQLSGPVNLASPNPTTDREFMVALRAALGVRFGVAQPRWLLELGAALIRTETELVLKSRWVVPRRLLEAGFDFDYPTVGEALAQIVAERGPHPRRPPVAGAASGG